MRTSLVCWWGLSTTSSVDPRVIARGVAPAAANRSGSGLSGASPASRRTPRSPHWPALLRRPPPARQGGAGLEPADRWPAGALSLSPPALRPPAPLGGGRAAGPVPAPPPPIAPPGHWPPCPQG